MATHKAIIQAWIEVEFDDDGISGLPDQAVDVFRAKDFDASGSDCEVVEVTETTP